MQISGPKRCFFFFLLNSPSLSPAPISWTISLSVFSGTPRSCNTPKRWEFQGSRFRSDLICGLTPAAYVYTRVLCKYVLPWSLCYACGSVLLPHCDDRYTRRRVSIHIFTLAERLFCLLESHMTCTTPRNLCLSPAVSRRIPSHPFLSVSFPSLPFPCAWTEEAAFAFVFAVLKSTISGKNWFYVVIWNSGADGRRVHIWMNETVMQYRDNHTIPRVIVIMMSLSKQICEEKRKKERKKERKKDKDGGRPGPLYTHIFQGNWDMDMDWHTGVGEHFK